MFNGMNFKSFTLDNQLQVLAISDPRFVKSSAALSVMAGSMQNPDEHLGLAHFLEHMLFLGTQDYPQVGEYEDFLNKNGGGHNAYTSIDHTNYFFDIMHSGFEGALQRFSRFFVCPTFDEKYVDREKNAVHSEHEKNLKDDGRREYRFLQMITDPSHPFSKFATGDKNTLAGANRDVVMKFYQEKYSANLMRLVLMSPLSENELFELAEKNFSDIRNKSLSEPQFEDQLFISDQVPKFHQVETVRDQDVLKISFDMPDDMNFWASKPTQFLAHLIGEEGEGSLLSYLKTKGLALGLETSTWWRMFHVKVQLTEKGKQEYQSIISILFSYLEILKKEGLKDYIFNERKQLAENELKYIEPKSSMGRASQYSAAMLYYPVESFLDRYYLYHEHSSRDFESFLSRLHVDNMQVSLLTKEKIDDKIEPFYGIGFRSEDFEPEFIEILRKPKVISELSYPGPNEFIADNLKLLADNQRAEPKEENYKNFATIYSQLDTELGIPKAALSLSFISEYIAKDPRRYIMAKLFSKVKKEQLNEWGYPARLAGLNFNISHGFNTITVDVSGYSQNLTKLLGQIINDPKNNRRLNHVEIDEDRFTSIKKKIKKNLQNREFDAAYQRLLSENSHFFSSASIHFEDYINYVEEISLAELNEFAESFFGKMAVRVFCYGNFDSEQIKPVVDLSFETLKAQGMTEKDVEKFENKYLVLEDKTLAYRLEGKNNNNAQLSFYKAAEWNIENQAHLDVLSKIIEQPFFTELRTHQQLGYIVASFTTSSYGYCGIGTLIQSQTHGAVDIYNRADSFMGDFLKQIDQHIRDEDVELIKQALITEITQMPNSLSERLSRFTMMAGTYHGDFDFLDKLCQQIKAVTRDKLVQFVKKNFVEKSQVPQISFLYQGSGSEAEKLPESFQEVQDLQDFRSQLKATQPYKKSKNLK